MNRNARLAILLALAILLSSYRGKCDAYIDAVTGRVVCIDIGIDMTDPDDWDNFRKIYFSDAY